MNRINAARNFLRSTFGARKYRILRSGEIHVFGTMPNTNIEGWYVYGAMGDSDTLCRLGMIV